MAVLKIYNGKSRLTVFYGYTEYMSIKHTEDMTLNNSSIVTK